MTILLLIVLLCQSLSGFAATATVEPLLFENVGQMVSGLSYIHTHIPINISELEERVNEYKTIITREFSDGNLETHYRNYVAMNQNWAKGNKISTDTASDNLQYYTSTLSLWPQIAKIHLREVDQLINRIQALYLTLPTVTLQETHQDEQSFNPPDYSPFTTPLPHLNKPLIPITPAHRRNTTHSILRQKRFIPILIAGVLGLTMATAGTAFGVMNRDALEALDRRIKETNLRQDQIVRVVEEVNKDLDVMRDHVHELLIMSFADRTFDTAVVLAKLQSQLQTLLAQTHRIECAIQQAQHHRLAINYLSGPSLLSLFEQVKTQAKRFGYRPVIERPSEIFQLDTSYTYDGKIISLLLHIPIAAPDAFMRLYKLHPFPLPFDNGTLLTHNVRNEILAISNSNHRYTIQMSTVDLLSCHRLGKIFLCERNGLLNKYPEDTCLGSLYHQKFDIAHQLCDFRVEPAKEFVYQLLNNWFMVFEPAAITIPVVCLNGTHSELHIRRGISKFHLTAGCTAEFPRYKLLSDISILIPQDYIQLEMDWDPVTFLPGVRQYLIPEIAKLGRMGATMTSLSTLQSMVASRLEDPSEMFHFIHFGFNFVTISLTTLLVGLICYRLFLSYREYNHANTARQVDLAVRTALNRTSSMTQLNNTLHIPDGNLTLDQFDSVSNIDGPRSNSSSISTAKFIGQLNQRPRPASSYIPNEAVFHEALNDELSLKYPSLRR